MDVGVVSSDFEGSPLAILEMMAAGVPVVSTAVGGVPDLIEDGVHGLLVPPRDPASLAAALERLSADVQARARMGAAAKARQKQEFSIDVMTERVASLYEELYERHLAA
jgi:glycosyltransferase involved in cell wall biosynthesis